MALTPELIESFSEAVLNSRYDNPKPTPAFHKTVWEYCCSDHKQVAIAAPRGHAKSTAGTLAYPLTALLFGYKDFILILSNTEKQATSFLLTIFSELADNELLIEMFGKMKFLTESKSEIIVQMENGRKFCVMARGATQSMRGAKWGHKRPDLVVFDDVEDDDTVANKEVRNGFKQHVLSMVLPIGGDTADIRIFGTILHLDSMLENYMPEYQVPETVEQPEQYINRDTLVTTCTYPDVDWHSMRFKAHDKDFTNILWPEKFTESRLKKIQRSYFRRGYPEGYAQEYLNYPIDDSTAYFKRADFLQYEKYGQEPLNYYIGTDFAVTTKDRSDYSVFVVAGTNSDGYLVVVDVIRERMDALEIADTLLILQRRYTPEWIAVEKGTIWNALKPAIERDMFATGRFINFNEIASTLDKQARARSMQNRMRAGAVLFTKDRDWYPTFEEELARFPKDVHDDQVDAFSIIGLGLADIMDAPTKEELDWEEHEEEVEEYYASFGSNPHTGY